MSRLKSEKQEKFVQEYAKTGNASAAYRAAGFKCGTSGSVRTRASVLLTKSNIQERLREIHKEIDAKSIADIKEAQQMFTKAMRGELDEEVLMTVGEGDGFSKVVSRRKEANLKDRLKAAELLIKTQGGFAEKIELSGNVPVTFVDDLK